MFKFLKIALGAWILFMAVAIIGGGGDQFRSAHEKAGGVTQKIVGLIADKADRFKNEADSIKEFIKNWSSKENKKEIAKKTL